MTKLRKCRVYSVPDGDGHSDQMDEYSERGEYYYADDVDAEIERLNLKCGALAYLQYGSSGPDDPWRAKLDEVTKPLHAEIESLRKALDNRGRQLGIQQTVHEPLPVAAPRTYTALNYVGKGPLSACDECHQPYSAHGEMDECPLEKSGDQRG